MNVDLLPNCRQWYWNKKRGARPAILSRGYQNNLKTTRWKRVTKCKRTTEPWSKKR